jgi:hypothetical protein
LKEVIFLGYRALNRYNDNDKYKAIEYWIERNEKYRNQTTLIEPEEEPEEEDEEYTEEEDTEEEDTENMR